MVHFRDGKQLKWVARLGSGEAAKVHLVELVGIEGKPLTFVLREVGGNRRQSKRGFAGGAGTGSRRRRAHGRGLRARGSPLGKPPEMLRVCENLFYKKIPVSSKLLVFAAFEMLEI